MNVCVKRMGERQNERMSKRMNRCMKEQMNEWDNLCAQEGWLSDIKNNR